MLKSGLNPHPVLCWLGSAADWKEVLVHFADLAEKEGFAHPGFCEAIIQREEEYPTGLPMQIPLAIPHAYPQFVIKPGVGIALLDPPVSFREMGGEEDQWLPVRLVVLMLATQEIAHNSDLSTIIRMFQNPQWYDHFSQAGTPEELAEKFQFLFEQAEQSMEPE
jgi:PTS system galactitol-specific IIA component